MWALRILRRPKPSRKQFEKLKRQSGELIGRWEDLQRRDLAAFQKLTAEGSLSTVVVPPPGRAYG